MLVEASSYTFSRVLLGTQISHTCTAGAVGQFASGIGNTDAGFVLGNGKILPNTKLASVLPIPAGSALGKCPSSTCVEYLSRASRTCEKV